MMFFSDPRNDTWHVRTHTNTQSLTSSVHDGQHDGGDPGDLTGRGIKDDLNFFEEDSDGLWEGVGEADGDEGPHHHHPAPPPLRRGVVHRPTRRCRHDSFAGRRRRSDGDGLRISKLWEKEDSCRRSSLGWGDKQGPPSLNPPAFWAQLLSTARWKRLSKRKYSLR